jgi:hypothetical protein
LCFKQWETHGKTFNRLFLCLRGTYLRNTIFFCGFHPVVNGYLTPEVASKNHEIKTDPYGQLRSNTELHMDIT